MNRNRNKVKISIAFIVTVFLFFGIFAKPEVANALDFVGDNVTQDISTVSQNISTETIPNTPSTDPEPKYQPWQSIPEGENTLYYGDDAELNAKLGLNVLEPGNEVLQTNRDGFVSIQPLNLNDWRAGNIMSDAVASYSGAMSEATIWNFLHSRGSCNDTNIDKAASYPQYSYHIENGHFVCKLTSLLIVKAHHILSGKRVQTITSIRKC